MRSVALVCHPSTPCEPVRRLEVGVRRASDAMLELIYSLEGDVANVQLPAEKAPCRADELWRHTCLEAFLAGADGGYYELNFSPSTEWAVYRFDGYRKGMAAVEDASAPRISVQRKQEVMSLTATVDLAALHALPPASRLALAAVIEQADGRLSYWALAHPVGRPDFHHAAGFTLALPQPKPVAPSGNAE